ncbi:MAG: HAMP domain-containing sensor histidine kinase [Acidobacteria bacterium]|nr:HAMP domain-containing sensor histidine kinase [Acidobacteriota bacterium]MDA1234318.1 HAMP domain-containing sensor histidine kinase [Acidobacteriota bacterium]
MASSLAAIVSAKRRLLVNLAWAVPLVIVLSLGGGYHVARSALQPIESVVAVAQGIDVGKLSERLDAPSSGDVVERLAKTFNGMLDRLEGSVRRLEEFTADASHELRSPVAVIRTTAELALRQDRTPTQLRSDMQEIEREAARLTSLIENLLTLARSDANGMTPNKRPVDLFALVVEVGDQHRRLHPSRALAVEIPSLYAYVLGDEASLRQLLAILLDNAVRHTPDEASITISLRTEGDAHRLSVADTGNGIPDDELGRIFDRFYRGDSSRGVDGGFGLGLSIARWIAESHDACIKVESVVGKGSVFSVRLSATPNDWG